MYQCEFTEARDSEWQLHQLGGMQISTLPQTDNHASIPPLSFLQAGCPSCHPTNYNGQIIPLREGPFTQLMDVHMSAIRMCLL